MKLEEMSCIDCAVKNCDKMDKTYPEFCLTTNMDQDVYKDAMDCYKEEENHNIMVAAAEVECDHYCQYTRVEEIMAFAERIVGLLKESRTLAAIFRKRGFTVFGITCKAGSTPKSDVGIPERCNKIGINMCNPILQAKMLNHAKTDLNVVVGLCVGHDSLFYKYSEAITTTMITKDRVLGHNPAAALYTADTYYKKLQD